MVEKPAEWQSWIESTRQLDVEGLLDWTLSTFSGRLAFATSLGAEDQALLFLLETRRRTLGLEKSVVDVFTLDTGRLPQETYDLLDRNRDYFEQPVRVVFPEPAAVEAFVAAKGANAFYRSIEDRKTCCHIRKVGPLDRALNGKVAWVTGLRRSQSTTRAGLDVLEWDADRGLLKVNPLVGWSSEDVWRLLRSREVPFNSLHEKGYPSIGCAPCTRAVAEGENERAGRWWWEQDEHKECGLHVERSQPIKMRFAGLT